MEQQQTQLNDQIKELKQEINNLRANMTLLDQEKDRLLVNEIVQQITLLFHKTIIYKIDHLFIYFFFQMALDEKTEKIAALERELMHKDQETEGIQQQIRDLQHQNE